MSKTKTTFEREFSASDAEKNLKEMMHEIIEEIKHKKIEDVKVRVEVSESKIIFSVVGR